MSDMSYRVFVQANIYGQIKVIERYLVMRQIVELVTISCERTSSRLLSIHARQVLRHRR